MLRDAFRFLTLGAALCGGLSRAHSDHVMRRGLLPVWPEGPASESYQERKIWAY